MAFPRAVMVTLALTITMCSSHSSESDGDQYKTSENELHLPHLLIGATDQHRKISNSVDSNKNASTNESLESKLQVAPTSKSFIRKTNKSNNRQEKIRKRRSYYPYSGYPIQTPQFPSISVWQPQIYPLQRPYYVPIFGADGRIPIYFPPQPFVITPTQQPPFIGPTYLPPVTDNPTDEPPTEETTTMKIDDRFGNDDDDRPIWDKPNSNTERTDAVPTRKPRPGFKTTKPPLIHTPSQNQGGMHLSNDNNIPNSRTTTTPAPPLPGPSRCVWAIVSCCSTSSKEVRYSCFEQLGCQGPFWDVSPCESDYAKAAIDSALSYYNSQS